MKLSKHGCTVYPIIVPTRSSLQSFNFYLVEKADTLTLIDAGLNSEKCWEALNRTLHENGFSLQDLTHIILTHNHQDHVGLVNRITSIREIPVYAHPESIHRLKRDKQFFSMRIDFFQQLYREMGCGEAGERQVERLKAAVREHEKDRIQADIIPFTEADTVAGLQVVETPGHSSDHVILLDAGRKWGFAGDQLISHISSNALVEPDRKGNRILSLCQYVDSLHKCLALDVETFFPGHGEFIHHHRDLIKARLTRIEHKAEKIRQLLESGLTTANQLALAYYPDKYESEFSLVMSEIIGLLDYLETKGKVTKTQRDGIFRYVPSP